MALEFQRVKQKPASDQTQESKPRKKKKTTDDIKFTRKTAILIIVGVLVVGVIAAVISYFSFSSYKFNGDAVYVVNGDPYGLPKGSTATIGRDGTITLKQKGGFDFEANEAAAFYKDDYRLVSLKPLGYYKAGQKGIMVASQVTPLTDITYSYGVVTIEKNKKSLTEEGEFLFDGENTYITLRDADLLIGDVYVTTLPAFSTVFSAYGSWVSYRNYETEEYDYITLNRDEDKRVTLVFHQDNVKVVCDMDRAITENEDFMLLTAITKFTETLR